jgi:tetratricopeptide (TPR) repeat protein
MKFLLLLICYLLGVLNSISAQPKTDILVQDAIDRAKNTPVDAKVVFDSFHNLNHFREGDLERTALLMAQGNFYKERGQYRQALEAYRETERIALKLGDNAIASKSYNNLGAIYSALGEWDSSAYYYYQALGLKLALNLKDEAGITFMNLANLENKRSNILRATEYYLKAIQIFDELGDPAKRAISRMNFGTCLNRQRFYDEALKQFQHARIILMDSGGDRYVLANIYINEGFTLMRVNRHLEAKPILQEAATIFKEAGDSIGLAFVYTNLGAIALAENNPIEAVSYMEPAFEWFRAAGDKKGMAEVGINLAVAYKSAGSTDKTYKLLLEAYRISVELGLQSTHEQAARELGKHYASKGDYNRAYTFTNEAYDLTNTILDEEILQIAQETQRKYFYEKHEKETLRQREELARMALEQEKNRIRWWSSLFAFLLVLSIVLWIVRELKQKTKLLAQENYLEQLRADLAEKTLAHNKEQMKTLELEQHRVKKELETMAIYLSQKNEFIENISKDLPQIAGSEVGEHALKRIKTTLLQSLQIEPERELINRQVDETYKHFSETLIRNYPQLQARDIKLCMLLQLGLSSKEMAAILNISPKSVDMARYRLRKKLQMEEEEDFKSFLSRMGLTKEVD